MKTAIFGRTLLSTKTLLLSLTAAMLALQLIVSYTYESFAGITGQMLESMPPEFAAFMKVQSGIPLGNDPNAYLTLGYYHPVFLVLGSAVAITVAAQALAGEIDRGTILYLLARPLHRWQVVLSKGAVLLPVTVIVTTGAVAGTALGTALSGVEIDIWRFVLAGINAWATFTAIGGVTLLCSALAGSAGQAASWAIAFALTSFFIDFLADLWEPIRKVEPLSLFHHYDPTKVVASGSLSANDMAFLLGLALVATILAILAFSRRDIRV